MVRAYLVADLSSDFGRPTNLLEALASLRLMLDSLLQLEPILFQRKSGVAFADDFGARDDDLTMGWCGGFRWW